MILSFDIWEVVVQYDLHVNQNVSTVLASLLLSHARTYKCSKRLSLNTVEIAFNWNSAQQSVRLILKSC